MCTVAFIPDNGKFYIASLRDEDPNRAKASLPVLTISDHQQFIAPIDPQGGGTWVGINERGAVIVLLNGGFINHVKKESYARSRGQIVTELLTQNDPFDSWNNIELTNIEPFTLIVWSETVLKHLVWDGDNKFTLKVDPTKPHIWSSSTLYSDSDKQIRQQAFDEWINHTLHKERASLFDFFKDTVDSKGSLFIKNGKEIKTHSYTFIDIIPAGNTSIIYQDLSTDKISRLSINNK